MVLLCAGFSWTSISYSAWATSVLARQELLRQYEIGRSRVWGGPMWSATYDLYLRNEGSGVEVVLPLRRSACEHSHWKSGESICVHGRTWIFGTMIEALTRDMEACGNKHL